MYGLLLVGKPIFTHTTSSLAYTRMPPIAHLLHPVRLLVLCLLLSPFLFQPAHAQSRAKASAVNKFELVETTISAIHRAFRDGSLTSEQLVKAYLDRIQAYDQPTH